MTTTAQTGKTLVEASEREEKLVNAFFVVYRNARIVEPTNRAYLKQCANFFELLRPFLHQDAEAAIKVVKGRYFTNEQFVRFSDNSGAVSKGRSTAARRIQSASGDSAA